MKKEKCSKQKNNKLGFTLLELLVVVLIIGILAAIALPKYQLAVLKSKYGSMLDFARVARDAQQRYYLINGKYTKNWRDLDIDYPGVTSSGFTLYFAYGSCVMSWWDDIGIICMLGSSNSGKVTLSYLEKFGTKIRACRVINITSTQTDTLEDKVCQLVTGKKQGKFDTDSRYYFY